VMRSGQVLRQESGALHVLTVPLVSTSAVTAAFQP
jgi:hypothetical protein